ALKYPDDVLDRPLRLLPSDEFVKAPQSWLLGAQPTLRLCFLRLFDLQMIPRRSFFQTLASISTDPDEKEKLLEFASPQGLDDYLDYTIRCRRTTAEVLRDFSRTSAAIPPERLFDLFTTIRPRAFSIASAPSQNIVEILVAKVEYRTRMAELRRGLCSTFISRLKTGDRVFVKIRPGTFKLPKEDKPVICVGPGTGVAPFRSYLTWRNRFKTAAESILFFGCRGRKLDFYFESEWKEMPTTKVFTAFSRDTPGEKVYVQNLILKHADEVWNIIGREDGRIPPNMISASSKSFISSGYIFIAGSAGDMPKDTDMENKHSALRMVRIIFSVWYYKMDRLLRGLAASVSGMGTKEVSDDPSHPDSAETVHISALALLKMMRHARSGVPLEVMGLMLGSFVDDYTINVIDVFAMPQSGTVSMIAVKFNVMMINEE
ncbi:FAD-binding FR-type domain-containing protein, partial [Trichostrongylus colubriformis]